MPFCRPRVFRVAAPLVVALLICVPAFASEIAIPYGARTESATALTFVLEGASGIADLSSVSAGLESSAFLLAGDGVAVPAALPAISRSQYQAYFGFSEIARPSFYGPGMLSMAPVGTLMTPGREMFTFWNIAPRGLADVGGVPIGMGAPVAAVPEPGSLLLVGTGLAFGLLAWRRRKA